MPLQATSGAASYDGFGGGVPFEPTYIEQVFATHLYTGNGSTQTITNGIDLSTKGGLVWMKARSSALSNFLCDTARGRAYYLYSDWNGAQQGPSASNRDLTSFNTDGFSLGQNANADINTNAVTFASWTFRKQPKFFDVVTYTGNGTAGRTVAHSLGSVPGCMIVKCTSDGSNWIVYHRGLGSPLKFLQLNTTIDASNAFVWNNTDPTATVFTVGGTGIEVNDSGKTYVAYLFAHDAGGFGLTGTDNVISCGAWTDSGSGTQTITLGYEPQFVIYKRTDASSNWVMLDNMRGWPVVNASGSTANLYPNLSNAESGGNYGGNGPTATGFNMPTLGGGTYIYIAIRRGPMKTPTSGTSVFTPLAYTGNGTNNRVITGVGFPLDLMIQGYRSSGNDPYTNDRLRGPGRRLFTDVTNAEASGTLYGPQSYSMDGYTQGSDDASAANINGNTYINWVLRRAPGFFDVVCYTGTGSARTQAHNLGVTPELMIFKRRNATSNWTAFYSIGSSTFSRAVVNLTNAGASWNYTDSAGLSAQPTSTTVALDGASGVNASGDTYVAYLFASCPGVSKVGSYTGNGSSQTINMGFTGGARFFLVKRTDSTGDWWVYDSARGIVANSDPALRLNSTAAEVTSADAVDTASVGLIVNQESTCNINVNGATYIFLAIA